MIFFFVFFYSYGIARFDLIFVDLCATHIQIPDPDLIKVLFSIFLISDE